MADKRAINETKNFITAQAKTNDMSVDELLKKVKKEITQEDDNGG